MRTRVSKIQLYGCSCLQIGIQIVSKSQYLLLSQVNSGFAVQTLRLTKQIKSLLRNGRRMS
jgi:hypothetical protein